MKTIITLLALLAVSLGAFADAEELSDPFTDDGKLFGYELGVVFNQTDVERTEPVICPERYLSDGRRLGCDDDPIIYVNPPTGKFGFDEVSVGLNPFLDGMGGDMVVSVTGKTAPFQSREKCVEHAQEFVDYYTMLMLENGVFNMRYPSGHHIWFHKEISGGLTFSPEPMPEPYNFVGIKVGVTCYRPENKMAVELWGLSAYQVEQAEIEMSETE